jgi:hypothetical protein
MSSEEVRESQSKHAAEPSKVELHPRFIVVDDDPNLKLKDAPKEQKTISCQVFGKDSTLFRRDNVGGPGKTCWFKTDTNVKEPGKICFANGVSPESKDYTLQVLLNQMDKKLMEDYHENHSAVQEAATDNDIHQKLYNIERQQKLERTIFAIDTENDDAPQQNKKKNKNKKGEKESVRSDRRTGRTVFYVTVGQMKHTRIFLKPRQQPEVCWKRHRFLLNL